MSRSLKIILTAFVVTRVVIFGFAVWIADHHPSGPPAESAMWHGYTQIENRFFEPWRRWDALWFTQVVREGYSYRGDSQSNVTIFPLYPLAIAAISKLTGNLLSAGLIVSNICFLISMLLLHDIVRLHGYGDDKALIAVGFMTAFPTAFIFSAVYSESLFTMLAMFSYRAMLKGSTAKASLCAMAASACRLSGVLLLPALAVMYLAARKWNFRSTRTDFFWLAAVPAGILIYFAYLYHLTGDPSAYFSAQKHWGHGLTSPLFSLAYEITMPQNFLTRFDVSVSLMAIVLSVVAWTGFGSGAGIYALSTVLVSMSATKLYGVPRYVLVAFPIYMGLASLKGGNWSGITLIVISFAMQLYVFFQFVTWRISL